MTTKLMMAFLVGFIVSSVVGAFLVPFLRKIKAGQMIKEIGPSWHMSKSGTPTMGGLMFIAGVTAACLTAGWSALAKGEYGHILCLLLALVFGAIGFLDDYEKLRHQQYLGLTAGKKFLLQLAASVVFILLMRSLGYISTELYIPFVNTTVSIPEPVYFILAAFIIVGTVNSVNLTDGVDGLATGTTIPVMLFFVVVTFCWGDSYTPMGVFASGLAGGLLGFLIYNFNPAKVFMGDTGSLFLGGAVAALAFAYDMPLILILVGFVYICETLSDIIQVAYFKLTHGKRIFKMASMHHHYEMCGWSEKKVVAAFTAVSLLFCLLAVVAVSGRFLAA